MHFTAPFKVDPRNRTRRACVFASSRFGACRAHEASARDVGRLLAERKWDTVFGGGPDGLMGAFARSFLAAGTSLVGVVPNDLFVKEQGQGMPGLTILTTPTIFERKRRMIEGTDLFIALPGGIGTLDELFDVLEMKFHGETTARIVLFSPDHYWDALTTLFDSMMAAGYVTHAHKTLLDRVADCRALEKILIEIESAPAATEPASGAGQT